MVLVEDYQLVVHDEWGLVGRLVPKGQLHVVDAVGQCEPLEVEEGELVSIGAGGVGAVELVFLYISNCVVLTNHEGDLHGGTVHPRLVGHQVQRPGIEVEVGFHIGLVVFGQVEGGITKEGRKLLLGCKRCDRQP